MSRNQSIRVKNTLLAASGGVILSVGLLYAFFQGYTSFSVLSICLFLSVFWVVSGSIIFAVRFGWSERFRDPSVSLFQMYWASLSSASCLLVTTSIDALFYLLALLPLVFGVFRLQIKQFRLYTIVIIIYILVVVVLRSLIAEGAVSLIDSLVVWLSFSFSAYTLSSLCRSVVNLQNRLREKNDQLQQAIQARTYFLANMSHEIRTPMNGVLGMLEISLSKDLGDDVRRHILTAKESSKALLTVINDILDFSKIESGKLTLESSRFDFQLFLEEVLASFKATVLQKNLELCLSVDKGIPKYVYTDPSRLRQILNNLIGNAVKFTERGRISVSVSPIFKESSSEEGHTLVFWVEDTGIGIAAEKIDVLFEHFTQADASTTREYGGAGLGLAIVKKLCELMGGEIVAESELGRGSMFRFTIAANFGSNEKASDKTECGYSESRLKGKSLLLVDDNPTNQEVTKLILSGHGAQVTLANDGIEALKALSSNGEKRLFDLILMDCQMPHLDGYATTQKIRSDDRYSLYSKVPIVALTANVMSGDRERCLAVGMSDYVSKPVDTAQMLNVLDHWLGGEIALLGSRITDSSERNSLLGEAKMTWNEQALLKVVGGKHHRIDRLLQSFSESFDKLIEEMQQSFIEGDFDRLSKQAHGLNGASGNLHFECLSDTCMRIEIATGEHRKEELHKYMDELLRVAADVKVVLSGATG